MAKLTKKSFKRKKMLMGLALFMSIALISTGFAAWVISSSVEKDGGGNVQAGTVSDKSITLEINNADDLGTFKFEPKKQDASGRVRYEGAPSENYESLSVVVSGSIDDPANYLNKLTIELEEINPTTNEPYAKADSNLYKAAQENYITLPECFYNQVSLFEVTENGQNILSQEREMGTVSCFVVDGTSKTFSYEISFGWGSLFEGVNPGYYYDGKNASGEDYASSDEDGLAIKNRGLETTEEVVKENLVQLRNKIYGTNETLEEQIANAATTKGPQYKVTVKATTN